MTSIHGLTIYPEEYIATISSEVEASLTPVEISDFDVTSLRGITIGPLTILPINWFVGDVTSDEDGMPVVDLIDYALTRHLNAYLHELQVDDGWAMPGDTLRDDLITSLRGPLSNEQRQLLISGIREIIRIKLILRRRWPEQLAKPHP